MSFLDDIPDLISDALGGDFRDATLTRTTVTAGVNPWDPPAGNTTTDYPCKALREEFGASWLAGGLVDATDVKILVLAATLSVTPEAGDRITIGSASWTVVPAGSGKPAVSVDPAGAVWELRCKA